MPKIIYTNFLGMTSASVYTNSKLAPADTFQSAFAVDPIRTPGILAIGRTQGSDFTNVSAISNPIIKVINYFTGTNIGLYAYALGIERGAKVHQIDTILDAVTNAGNFPYTIGTTLTRHGGHTSFTGEDISLFKEANTNRVLYSWNDNTDGDVGMMNVDGSAPNDDYFSDNSPGNVVLGKFPHPIVRGDNGFYYVADGNSLHKVDGTTAPAAITLSAIDLPPGWIIYDTINDRGQCWILAREQFNYSSSVTTGNAMFRTAVFKWNYISNRAADFSGFSIDSPFFLEYSAEGAAGVIGWLFLYENVIHSITYTVYNRTQIRRFNGTQFVPVYEMSGNYLPTRGGIIGYKGHIAWLAADGSVCTWGRVSPDFDYRGNIIGLYTGNGSAGFLSTDFGGNYYASFANTHVAKLSGIPTSASLTFFVRELPKFAMVKSATVFYRAITDVTASTLSLNLFRNYSTTRVPGTYSISHATEGAAGYKYFPLGGKNFTNTNALGLNLTWVVANNATDAIEPYRIEVEYDSPPKKK